MIDFNDKFDRQEPPVALNFDEIRELVNPHLLGAKVGAISLLGGGFANSNYRLHLEDNTSVVLRISTKPLSEFRKELQVLNLLRGTVPVPQVIGKEFSKQYPFAILEFIEGEPLSMIMNTVSPQELNAATTEAGKALHVVHSFDLGKAGFFDEHFIFKPEFTNFGKAWYDYICSALGSERVQQRLGKVLQERALNLVQSKRAIYKSITNTTRLIHCDYNPKNIMMRRIASQWRVTAILDWEFAASGSPLADLGNFLRFDDELPHGFSEAFVQGYAANSALLVDNWREIAKLLDLAAMMNFLESQKENPKTFRTAVSVIKRTIETLESEP